MTDQEILEQIQYTLMEPPDLGATWPSGLWTQAEVLARANERMNRLLKEGEILTGIATLPVVSGVGRVALPDDWLWTQAVVYRGDDGSLRELLRADTFQADHGNPNFATTAELTPELYFDVDPPMLQIGLTPVSTQDGVIDLFYLPSGETLDGTGIIINLPDELAECGQKYGTLADLLSKDGRGRSPDRAEYCEERFQLAAELCQLIIRSSWVG